MCEKQEDKDSLVIANEVCQRLRKNLQERLTPETPLEKNSLPFYVRCIKESLLYRSTELAATAIDLYQQNKLVSAATITRSLLETTALFERLRQNCVNFVKKHEKHRLRDSDLQEHINSISKISLSTTDPLVEEEKKLPIEPFRAPALVNSLGTRYKFNAEEIYVSLCQMAHPNFEGCMSSFMKYHESYVEFIQDYHHMPEKAPLHQNLLASLLSIVESLKEEMTQLIPEYEKVCEKYRTI